MNEAISNLWQKLIELLFPPFCLECKKEGSFLCEECLKTIPLQTKQYCPFCQRESPDGSSCSFCVLPDFYLDKVLAVCQFEKKSLLQKAIHAFKYDFITDLAAPLGQLLYRGIKTFEVFEPQHLKNFIVCSIPLHKKRLRFRGFNQSELLARQFVELHAKNSLHLQFIPFLKRTHFQKAQMESSREERILNARNAFALNDKISAPLLGTSILLIDDVATTLSTLNNCAKVLKENGAVKVYALVLARAGPEKKKIGMNK
jgi:competence protein ComFC